jgi:hypothetical protein
MLFRSYLQNLLLHLLFFIGKMLKRDDHVFKRFLAAKTESEHSGLFLNCIDS